MKTGKKTTSFQILANTLHVEGLCKSGLPTMQITHIVSLVLNLIVINHSYYGVEMWNYWCRHTLLTQLSVLTLSMCKKLSLSKH